MGRVFRALDLSLDRFVAIKVLLSGQATDRESLERFHAEAVTTAKLDHDGIIRVFEMGEDRGLHYIALELVEGSNIRNLVQWNLVAGIESLHFRTHQQNSLRLKLKNT
jgi:serine/threonine protein kinase